MTVILRFALMLSVMFAALPVPAFAQELKWHDAASFEIEGRGWTETEGKYDRLPDSAKSKVSQQVWGLSKNNAGVCIRFVTDAAAVNARWSVTSDTLGMPHMPATGVSGIDLYARADDGKWLFVGNGRPHHQDNNQATFTFRGGAKAGRECLLYLPAYNGIKSLEIAVAPGAHLEKPQPHPEALRKPVVVYGTSIAQGGCASRPGMVWTSILGRMLDRPVINLGFSGSGTMEHPVGEVLAEVDAAAFVIDCIWNMSDDPAVYQERVRKLVHAIRERHPDVPILFVGQSEIHPELHPTKSTKGQEAAVQALQAEGVKGLLTFPGTDLVGDDGEGTVDGVHLTDLGMLRQAQALFPIVKKTVQGK